MPIPSNSIFRCFRTADLRFAVHPLDEDRAFKLLAHCREHGVRYSVVISEIREFLDSKSVSTEHLAAQMDEVEKMFKPWLDF